MFRFLALAVALLAAFFAPAAARAASPLLAKNDGPTFVLQVQSVDHLLNNAEYIAGLVGEDETVKQVVGVARLIAGEKGIEGVDIKKPFLVYGYLNQELINSDVVVMIPVADMDSFMGLLKTRLSLDVKDEKEGLFSLETPNSMGTVYFRLVNGYVYATYLKKENVAVTKVPKPENILSKEDSVISIGVRIDRLPEEIKKFAVGAIEEALVRGKERKLPNESPQIKALKDKGINGVAAGVKAVLFDGQQIALNINVDSKKDELSVDFDLTAKKDSELARDALKQALPIAGPAMRMEFSVGQLVTLLTPKDEKAIKQAAKKVFGDNSTADKIIVSVETQEGLHAKVAVNGKILKFVHELEQAKKAESVPESEKSKKAKN